MKCEKETRLLIVFQLSVNGYIAFATVLDQGPTINVGVDSTNWPRQEDPAMIAPYLCKQQVPIELHKQTNQNTSHDQLIAILLFFCFSKETKKTKKQIFFFLAG